MSDLSKIEEAGRAERRARAASVLVLGSELLPGPVPLPDFATLLARRTRRQRLAWMSGTAASLGMAALACIFLLRDRTPIVYAVDGTVAISDDVIEAPGTLDGALALVRFSEGSEVGLAPGARLRVVERTARGAALALERGRAHFAVSHRPGARWSVATGPFTVDVIGTRFSLDWSPKGQRLIVDLTSGSVEVRGASVGGPVAMHAGERLTATAADRRVTLSPLPEPPVTEAAAENNAAENNKGQPSTEAEDLPGVTAAASSAMPPVAALPPRVRPSHRAAARANRRFQLALMSPQHVARSAHGKAPAMAPTKAPTLIAASAPPSAPAPAAVFDTTPVVIDEAPHEAAPAAAPPPRVPQPTMAPNPTLGMGGAVCAREVSQYRFERPESGILLPDYYTLAFSNPRTDHSRSWCGQGALRVDASFNDAGRRNFFGRFPKETGQVVLKLHRATDFTGRTVTVHFFVEGPADAHFTAELVVVNRGRWVSGPPSGQLTTGRWWTISHRFESENEAGVPGSSNPGPFPVGGTSPVTSCDRLGVAIHSTGGRRVWTGAVYVDDVSWR